MMDPYTIGGFPTWNTVHPFHPPKDHKFSPEDNIMLRFNLTLTLYSWKKQAMNEIYIITYINEI